MYKFVYDEVGRNHTLNGLPLPSVTEIISPLSDFSMIPPAVLQRKCELGINFHRAIELHMEDDLVMDSLDPDIVKPMETFIEWWDRESEDIHDANVVIEEPCFHSELEYCGKPDLEVQGEDAVLYDFKLRPYNTVTDTLQMAGYDKCLMPVRRELKVLSFDIKGKLKIYDAKNSQAWPMFQAMLLHWKDTQKLNKLLKTWKEIN